MSMTEFSPELHAVPVKTGWVKNIVYGLPVGRVCSCLDLGHIFKTFCFRSADLPNSKKQPSSVLFVRVFNNLFLLNNKKSPLDWFVIHRKHFG